MSYLRLVQIDDELRDIEASLMNPGDTSVDHSKILAQIERVQTECVAMVPPYREGEAKARMLGGKFHRTRDDITKALMNYDEAFRLMTTHVFKNSTLVVQEQLLEEALWRRFELTLKLGRQKDAARFAREALDGVYYLDRGVSYFDSIIAASYDMTNTGRGPNVRVKGCLRRFRMRFMLVFAPQ